MQKDKAKPPKRSQLGGSNKGKGRFVKKTRECRQKRSRLGAGPGSLRCLPGGEKFERNKRYILYQLINITCSLKWSWRVEIWVIQLNLYKLDFIARCET